MIVLECLNCKNNKKGHAINTQFTDEGLRLECLSCHEISIKPFTDERGEKV